MATSIDFPSTPSIDDTYTYPPTTGTTYQWDGTRWVVQDGVESFIYIDDVAPTYEADHLWFQPSESKFHVAVSGAWVEFGRDGIDAVIGTDTVGIAELKDELSASSALAGTNVDWSLAQVFTKTLTVNTTLTFSNIYIGVKSLEISGNFTLTFPAGFKVVAGSNDYDGTVLNLIEVECTNEIGLTGWINITQEKV